MVDSGNSFDHLSGAAWMAAQRAAYVRNVGHEPPEPKTTPDWTLKPKDWIACFAPELKDRKPLPLRKPKAKAKASASEPARKADLSPLQLLEAAARYRKDADRKFRRAIVAAREQHGAIEVARAAGVSRQRVYQITSCLAD